MRKIFILIFLTISLSASNISREYIFNSINTLTNKKITNSIYKNFWGKLSPKNKLFTKDVVIGMGNEILDLEQSYYELIESIYLKKGINKEKYELNLLKLKKYFVKNSMDINIYNNYITYFSSNIKALEEGRQYTSRERDKFFLNKDYIDNKLIEIGIKKHRIHRLASRQYKGEENQIFPGMHIKINSPYIFLKKEEDIDTLSKEAKLVYIETSLNESALLEIAYIKYPDKFYEKLIDSYTIDKTIEKIISHSTDKVCDKNIKVDYYMPFRGNRSSSGNCISNISGKNHFLSQRVFYLSEYRRFYFIISISPRSKEDSLINLSKLEKSIEFIK